MKKKIKPETVKTIIISIACSILASFLFEPLQIFLGSISQGLITAFYNTFYTYCANSLQTTFLNYIIHLVVINVMLYLILTTCKDIRVAHSDISEINENLSKLQDLKQVCSKCDDKQEVQNYKNADSAEEKINEIEKSISLAFKCNKKIVILGRIFIPLVVLYAFYIIFLQYMPSQLKESFDISIIKITPYVSTEEIQELQSNWTLMNSKEDFEVINDRIMEIIEQNNLE